MDRHPRRHRRARQPEAKVQRMNMPRPPVDAAALKRLGPDQIANARPVQRFPLVIAIVPRQPLGIGMHRPDLARPATGDRHPRARIDAVHRMGLDQVRDQRLGLFRHVPQRMRRPMPHHPLKVVLIPPLAGPDLTAVPPRRAEPDPLRLKHHHAQPGLRQMQRRRQPGIPRPHHTDIRPHLALQRRQRVQPHRRCGIPRGWILPGPVIGVQQVHTLVSRCSRSHGLITCRNSLYSLRLTES